MQFEQFSTRRKNKILGNVQQILNIIKLDDFSELILCYVKLCSATMLQIEIGNWETHELRMKWQFLEEHQREV